MGERQMHCPICGVRLTKSNRSVDHFIPKALGGSNIAANKWVICRPCNNRKGGRAPTPHEVMMFTRVKAKAMKEAARDG